MGLRLVYLLLATFVAVSYSYPFTGNSLNDEEEDIIDLSHLGGDLYGEPDNKTGDIVAAYNPSESNANPEELGNYLEGDMLMPRAMSRNGLTASTAKWPGGVVPYEIRGSFGKHLNPIGIDILLRKLFWYYLFLYNYRRTSNANDRNGFQWIPSSYMHSIQTTIRRTRLHFDCERKFRMLVERGSHRRQTGECRQSLKSMMNKFYYRGIPSGEYRFWHNQNISITITFLGSSFYCDSWVITIPRSASVAILQRKPVQCSSNLLCRPNINHRIIQCQIRIN